MNKGLPMTFKQRVIVWGILLVVAFGLGFWLGYGQVRSLRSDLQRTQLDLAAAQERIRELEYEARLAELRHLAALMYAETNRQNYEVASNYSTRYFNELRRAADASENPEIRNALEELLETRDPVTAELARGRAAALDYVQALFFRTHEATRTQEESNSSR